jgi:hypothetical protein
MKTIQELPTISKENFAKFIGKHVKHNSYNTFVLCGIEKPKNLAQFKEITKKLYGVSLSVECFAYPMGSFSNDPYVANYKILEKDCDYSKGSIYQLWSKQYGQYVGLNVLLDWCFGELFCGGVARSHYGQTRIKTKSDYIRIKKWNTDTSAYTKHVVEQDKYLKDIFGFNPFV